MSSRSLKTKKTALSGQAAPLPLVIGMLWCGCSLAQMPDVSKVPTESPTASGQSGLSIEPSITLRHTATNNARLDATQLNDQITELSPGLRVVANTARIQGFADYSLRLAHYAKGTASDQVWHNLNARGTVEAVQNAVFIDVSGAAGLQPISAFGAPGVDSPANPNLTQTTSFRISPYLRGTLGDAADYELRYSLQEDQSDADNRADVRQRNWRFFIGSQTVGQLWGWTLDASDDTADFSNGRSIETTSLRGRLIYYISPQFQFFGTGGVESTNQVTPTRESRNIWGGGFDWRPSVRSRISMERENRYFGESHNVLLEYRTARTLWSYVDRKNINTGLGDRSLATIGSLYDLLDNIYARIESNSIRRSQLVLQEIERRGVPANTQVFPDYLTSSSTVQRLQQLSLALLGQRSTVTVAVSRSDSRALDGLLRLGDDFDVNTRIRQRGWHLTAGHRLTPNASVNASLSDVRSLGSAPGQETRVRSFALGWDALVARRTSVGIQLRRSLLNGGARDYSESAITGFITHRF